MRLLCLSPYASSARLTPGAQLRIEQIHAQGVILFAARLQAPLVVPQRNGNENDLLQLRHLQRTKGGGAVSSSSRTQ